MFYYNEVMENTFLSYKVSLHQHHIKSSFPAEHLSLVYMILLVFEVGVFTVAHRAAADVSDLSKASHSQNDPSIIFLTTEH